VEEARANVVLDKVRATLKSGEFKRQDQLIERLLDEGFSSTDRASALLHHLQGGEGAPAAKAPREEAVRPRYERPAPPAREERYGSRDERPRPDRDQPPHRRERSHEPQRREFAPRAAGKEPVSQAPRPHEAAPPRVEAPRHAKPNPVPPPKVSRRVPEGQTCLHLNVGSELGVSEGDVVGTILGETGLPRTVVGAVDLRERHLFVNVASEHANSILSKLNRAQIKGRKAKAKVA
jgi:ATP-dependent RNA helicase DeaD